MPSAFSHEDISSLKRCFKLSEGISLDPVKVASLKATEVHSFLFLTGANADLLEGFEHVTAPLRLIIVSFVHSP